MIHFQAAERAAAQRRRDRGRIVGRRSSQEGAAERGATFTDLVLDPGVHLCAPGGLVRHSEVEPVNRGGGHVTLERSTMFDAALRSAPAKEFPSAGREMV